MPSGAPRKLLRWAKNLFFTSPPDSVWERVAVIVWNYYVLEELSSISSFEEAHELYTLSRPKSPERLEVFKKLLQYADSKEKAQFVVNFVPKNTDESRMANEKLAEF
ncbi:TPA: hypothetical protein DEP58_01095 [Patescibacteria group bacterium]|nr:hypothetical protein [Patescibacteria group bacterium]